MNDFDKAVEGIIKLLSGKSAPLRANLREVATASGMSSTSRSRLFSMVNDILTLQGVNSKIGDWCVAEIEGTNVQFNPVVALYPEEPLPMVEGRKITLTKSTTQAIVIKDTVRDLFMNGQAKIEEDPGEDDEECWSWGGTYRATNFSSIEEAQSAIEFLNKEHHFEIDRLVVATLTQGSLTKG